jgi:hypothetical protein
VHNSPRAGSVGPIARPPDPGGQTVGPSQVGPHPADDVPVLVAHRVLASLLREDRVPGVLTGQQQAAVLDPAVELAQQPVFLPREVRASDEAATGRVDLVLQR